MAPRRETEEQDVIFRGLGVASGIAIGTVYLVEPGEIAVPEYEVSAAAVEDEVSRFLAAYDKSQRQLRKLKSRTLELHGMAGEELGFLLDAHAQMLASGRLRAGIEKVIREKHRNAEAAVHAEITTIAQGFAALEDEYLSARVADVREVGNRLIRNLTANPYQAFSNLPVGTIVLAEDLTPADTALMNPKTIAGFATSLGGRESHTAIMARSLGIPAVLGIPDLVARAESGDAIILDGQQGVAILRPSGQRVLEYRKKRAELEKYDKQLARLRRLPAVTRDGQRVGLLANIELPREAETALSAGAEGVGLLRTEYLYMNRGDVPGEEEQYQSLRTIVETMAGRQVTIRTLDIGGEKATPALEDKVGAALNPALGMRAIRLSLRERPLLEAQLSAILRASQHGNVRILLPMITSVSEVVEVRRTLEALAKKLRRRNLKIPDPLPPLGVMIEVPGAALAADALAQVSDFFAIGSNDLTMYTLAIDRGEESVAHLYNPLHPAVLRLIQFATEAALRARLPISVCGEIAGDPKFAPLLLGLGIQDLSMAATSLPRVKARIRSMDYLAATRCARFIMDQWDAGRIAAILDDFNALAQLG
ncbi:MAG TPA: phosphoenolpyruvate--protein phosphotransferase [Dongiaceae bacterium]|jgi:phosphotransferase system enzyme I (PtsI)|nr:phosphoenolpyruvate--protein phosphotransferase [Dongiaceae bacterium]